MSDNGPLAVRILLSAHFRVGGRKHRMRDHLRIETRVAGKRAVAGVDGLAVPVQEIVRHTEPCGGKAIGAVKTEGPF